MLKRSFKWWLMVLLCCFFAGCGIKGPLHLPQDKKATPTPAENAPAPASAPAESAPTPTSQGTTK